MSCRPKLVLLLVIIMAPLVRADSESGEDIPSLELLEFLGKWETPDGEWIDPMEFDDEDFIKLLELTEDEPESTGK